MPFLRVIRDKRGYETTYLMHWYREGNRQRSRILYVFRTPGGVRVGREALEPDVLRTIEARYPDIEFDWKAVVDNQQVVEPVPELRRQRKRRRSEQEGERAPAAPGATPAGQAPPRDAGQAVSRSRPPVPSLIAGATADEQIAFLNIWYPIVRERIPQRTGDPVRQEALQALAERLNPATWTDADQITAGLQQAAEALERLSRVFSKRRRRARHPTTGSGRPELVEGRPSTRSTSLLPGTPGVTLSGVEGSESTVSNVEPSKAPAGPEPSDEALPTEPHSSET